MPRDAEPVGPLKLRAKVEQWPLVAPFRITGHTWEHLDVLVVSLETNDHVGLGEAAGVYYKNDTPVSMLRQVMSLSARIEGGLNRSEVQKLLPPGGARNALDCALWDLQAKVTGRPVWQVAGLDHPRPLLTTFTCGADTPEKMAAAARAYEGARAIKVKLTGAPEDVDRIRAVREAKPHVWLGVDGNQGFTSRDALEKLLPVLGDTRVALIEQPFPIGQEALLDGLKSPIPIAADETAQSLVDIPQLVGRFQVVNIKLDKAGGLTEGLAMARAARELGLDCMVGNMLGTSLAMGPAYLLGQLSKVVDLDGPVFLKADRANRVRYVDGFIECPDTVWGS
jgi:L-alanine-DL-glutamate epimerase-like enolase superfamily enzyme